LPQQAFLEPLIDWLATVNPSAASTQSLIDLILASDSLITALERYTYLLQEKLNLPAESLSFMGAHPEIFALNPQNELSWPSLYQLSLYHQFLPELPEDIEVWHQLLQNWTGTTFLTTDRPQLAALLQTDRAQLNSLLGNLVLPTQVLEALHTLSRMLELAANLGLNGAALQQLTASDYEGLVAASNLVYGAIRAKYDEPAWAEIVEPYQDQINMIKRDVLVDRILSKEFQLKFRDARELYQFFLLDVEMDGCARISRVKEAISACQLYVHRCRMNLEQSESGVIHVFPEDIPGDEWEWRQNYRVWEANRKVFLYPENWLEPDLRDNKTPIFKQLESDLLQNTITPESVEAAYRNYLREFSKLAKLIVVSSYYDDQNDTYLFFARTTHSPYQYYWRKFIEKSEWTPWEAIDLVIAAPAIAPTMYNEKLYLFWIDLSVFNRSAGMNLQDAVQESGEQGIPIAVEYTFLTETGQWHETQTADFYDFQSKELGSYYTLIEEPGATSHKIYPEDVGAIRVIHPLEKKEYTPISGNENYTSSFYQLIGYLDEYDNVVLNHIDKQVRISDQADQSNEAYDRLFASVKYQSSGLRLFEENVRTIAQHSGLGRRSGGSFAKSEAAAEKGLLASDNQDLTNIVRFPYDRKNNLQIVHHRVSENVLTLDNQQFLICQTGKAGYKQDVGLNLFEILLALENSKRRSIRLTTTVADKLGKILFGQGLDAFLNALLEDLLAEEGALKETSLNAQFVWLGELTPPLDTGELTQLFNGAYSLYFRELYCQIPFLIANHLNALQKFEQADYWYRKIFDPTASENPEPSNPADRNWRYVEFRNQGVPKLKSILTNEAAIARYKEDPFNPFAIARLRMSAYQKAIVMKYVDNLLDWGDHLFGQDTYESINEATMLYVMAADILGDRPVQAGDCKTANESALSYQKIASLQQTSSEFLIELENFSTSQFYIDTRWEQVMKIDWQSASKSLIKNGSPSRQSMSRESMSRESMGNGFTRLRNAISPIPMNYIEAKVIEEEQTLAKFPAKPIQKIATRTSIETAQQRSLAFCVPPNAKLLSYWERVDDRLYKIRHCMNIQGARRQLALFQPPIDPGLLVRAKAAGLSLEDALNLLTADLPAYRFTHLIGRAKQFTHTVQSFGNTLLGALEKKDVEELTLLRAVHEQNLLEFIKRVKEEHHSEAEAIRQNLESSKAVIEVRKQYYEMLLEEAKDQELAINEHEQTHIFELGRSKSEQELATQKEREASLWYKRPTFGIDARLGGGFSFNVLPGPVANFTASIAYGSSNIAASSTYEAQEHREKAIGREYQANLASISGNYVRRKAEWEYQRNLADKELEQIDRQLIAADIRIAIAAKDLESHHKQIQQAQEMYDFYKGKFSNVGLYTYLSTSLSRLYREAYNMAYSLAQKAQRAYQFELDDNTFFVANDNWPANKAGLLAGERLLLQLQRIEQAYLEQNRRDFELTKHVSLGLLDPLALVQLRETGQCFINLPEESFDLDYPGHYFRRIKSVSLTLPCVVGPYTTIPCTLRLLKNSIRINTTMPHGYPHNADEDGLPGTDDRFMENNIPVKAIATSHAQNDSGVFELNFRDERYLPFEGAGAISQWSLELFHDLPANNPDAENPDFGKPLRQFDYSTITDAILHIKYTAREDAGLFKNGAIDHLRAYYAQDAATSLLRMFNLRQEFPSQWQQFLHPTDPANGNVFNL
ncbi:MAG: neuraminidase-like domain-containing protein, partial [Cyanobacteria bacterium P01_F01_bin.86]